jgi:uncharacterized phage-associated protein
MHSCLKVANYLLQLARRDRVSLTPMQLIKLVYMCHGWMLGLYGRPLIGEPVQAWKYGPVIPELYRHLSKYAGRPVTHLLPRPEGPDFSALEANLIEQVYVQNAAFDGVQLSEMTHKVGSPWHQIWDPEDKTKVIPNEIIRAYHARLAGTVAG